MLPLLAPPHGTAKAEGQPQATTVALLVPHDQEPQVAGVVDVLEDQLADLPVSLHLARLDSLSPDPQAQIETAREVSEGTGASIVFWVDLAPPARVTFYVAGTGKDPVVRYVEGAGSQARLETLAMIVRGSVRAALKNGAIDEAAHDADVSAEIPMTPPSGQTEQDKRGWFDLELSYAFEAFSTDQPASHAIDMGFSVSLHELWAIFFDYRHFFGSMTAKSPQVEARLRRHPISIGARFRWPLARLELGADLAATLDYVEMNTWAPGVIRNPDQSDFVFSISPLFRASYRVFRVLRVFVAVGAEFFVNQRRYGVVGPTTREVLLDPWPVSPRLLLGVSAELF